MDREWYEYKQPMCDQKILDYFINTKEAIQLIFNQQVHDECSLYAESPKWVEQSFKFGHEDTSNSLLLDGKTQNAVAIISWRQTSSLEWTWAKSILTDDVNIDWTKRKSAIEEHGDRVQESLNLDAWLQLGDGESHYSSRNISSE